MLPLLAWSGAACGDGCGSGTTDCGEPISVSWSPEALPIAPLVRLCVEGRCNDVTAPYANEATGDLSASPWIEPIPDDGVEVRLELLDDDGQPTSTIMGVAEPERKCGCDAVRLTVSEDGGSLVEK